MLRKDRKEKSKKIATIKTLYIEYVKQSVFLFFRYKTDPEIPPIQGDPPENILIDEDELRTIPDVESSEMESEINE